MTHLVQQCQLLNLAGHEEVSHTGACTAGHKGAGARQPDLGQLGQGLARELQPLGCDVGVGGHAQPRSDHLRQGE